MYILIIIKVIPLHATVINYSVYETRATFGIRDGVLSTRRDAQDVSQSSSESELLGVLR